MSTKKATIVYDFTLVERRLSNPVIHQMVEAMAHGISQQAGTAPYQNRADAIAAQLTEAIHTHRLSPGMKLSEDEVCSLFGVGRTIARSALQKMAHAELVTIEPHRGAFVATPSVREAREVFEARALLEPRTARSAAERAGPTDIDRLRLHIAEEHDALDKGEMGKALMLSGTFHIEIARLADQQTIERMIRQLISRSSLIIALYWRRQSAVCEHHAHDALLEAFRIGDGDLAQELMKGHLVDLLSMLDLRPPGPKTMSLKEALA